MQEEIYGNVHSIETFGTVDGPGIRFVVFLQGCPMRCLYCHNPDTWEFRENKKMSIAEILKEYESVKEFLKNGGLTVTGGEPLCQIDFVSELFKSAKLKNIHTALDTSGILFNKNNTEKIDQLLNYTDLVMLDIKHINDEEHKKLTKHSNKAVLEFAQYLSDKNIPVWIRHVVVPSITYNEKYLSELGEFLKRLKNIKALDVLPYHDLAVPKYENLGIDYPLKGIPPLTKEQALKAREIILKAYRASK
ncbi:MAG: pyruvate formate lyase-activating protein [Candidatus Gastranaerophilales bacterium]|nr:pyruvate formate lyase-activating protein [Candidatus Gastranaerophilales bacterium]